MTVADTGAVLALIDASDRYHTTLRDRFLADPGAWVLPWAVLPEVDYLVGRHLGSDVARAFRADLAAGLWTVEWDGGADLARAAELDAGYPDLELGLVDTLVMAVAERLGAEAIATLDVRDFGAVTLRGGPALWPRDL
ncbi:MAG: PIN domain-containing protein [Longimicrobiales bacterium]